MSDLNSRLSEIVNAAASRRDSAARLAALIETELDALRAHERGTAAMQHYLLGVQRELALEQSAALHIIADAAGVR